MKSALRIATLSFLALLLATNVYRAATQTVTHDEALTWELYLAGPVSDIFNVYDANHHFLSTVLERISTGMLGLSPFTLRLPALLAGALFLAAVYRLARLVFGETLLLPLAVAVTCTNPLVLDFLVAARGYGLALALFVWALSEMVGYLSLAPRERTNKALRIAACALGLSVTANLIFLFPVAISAALFLFAARLPKTTAEPSVKKRKPKDKPQSGGLLVHFVAPLGGIALLFFLLAPVSTARAADFYVGSGGLLDSLRNMVEVSLAHNTGVANLNPAAAAQSGWLTLHMVLWPLAVVGAFAAGIVAYRRGEKQPLLLLAPAALVGSLALLAAAHYIAGFPYPADRTGIYFIALAPLCLLALIRWIPSRAAAYALTLPLAFIAAQYLLQWNTNHFYVWRYNADTRAIIEHIQPRKGAPVRVGVSWQLEPSFNFYRVANHLDWMALVTRTGPTGVFDYYVLIPQDQALLTQAAIHAIYTGPISGTVLAVRTR